VKKLDIRAQMGTEKGLNENKKTYIIKKNEKENRDEHSRIITALRWLNAISI